MATRKNNWLNAKPVTKAGGKSGGARNPAKPYNKPASTSGTPKVKTKTQKLQQAAKTKPSSPAPKQVIKKPVTRTGPVKGPVPPKGYSAGAAGMPNSAKAQLNLPKTGARAERTATRAIQPSSPIAKPAASATKSAPKSSVKPPSTLRRAGGGLVAGTVLTGAAAKAIETLSRAANPNEWNRVQQELKDRGYGGSTPVNKDPNGRSSRGVSTPKGRTVPTGSQQYNDYRNKQIADNRERLKGVGNPPASKPPKPPAPTQDRGGSTQDRGGNNAPRRQPGPAADAGMKNQDKNYKGSYVTKTKEETARMTAASMSRQQGRSNLTSQDLKPKQQEPKMKPQYEGNDEPGRLGQREVPSGVPKKDTKAQTKITETLAERIRRRRLGM